MLDCFPMKVKSFIQWIKNFGCLVLLGGGGGGVLFKIWLQTLCWRVWGYNLNSFWVFEENIKSHLILEGGIRLKHFFNFGRGIWSISFKQSHQSSQSLIMECICQCTTACISLYGMHLSVYSCICNGWPPVFSWRTTTLNTLWLREGECDLHFVYTERHVQILLTVEWWLDTSVGYQNGHVSQGNVRIC